MRDIDRITSPFFRKKHVYSTTHHPTYAARHTTTFPHSHSSSTTFDRRPVQTTPARRSGAAPQTVTEARLTGASNALSAYSRTIPTTAEAATGRPGQGTSGSYDHISAPYCKSIYPCYTQIGKLSAQYPRNLSPHRSAGTGGGGVGTVGGID